MSASHVRLVDWIADRNAPPLAEGTGRRSSHIGGGLVSGRQGCLRHESTYVAALGAIAAILVGCSGGESEESSASRAQSTVAVSARPTMGTLPGEAVGSASDRIIEACMAEFGIAPQIDGQGDVVYDMNPATTPTRGYQDIMDACTEQVNSAGLNNFPALSEAQLRERYPLLVEWRDCIVDLGYDIGPIISLEEWLASSGQENPVPGYFAGTDRLSANESDAIEAACPQP